MKSIVLGFFVIAGFFYGEGEFYAQCACANPGESAYGELKRSEAVFVGEVTEVKRIGPVEKADNTEFDVTFKIKTVWKTDLPEFFTLKNIGDKVSDFREKENYLVYAHIHEKVLFAYLGCCTRTRPLLSAGEDLKEFEERGEKPTRVIKASTFKFTAQPNNSFNRSGICLAFIRKARMLDSVFPARLILASGDTELPSPQTRAELIKERIMSNAPLSTLMAEAYSRPGDAHVYYQFIVAFSRSIVGVIAEGVPAGAAGRVESTREHPFSLSQSVLPDGSPVLLTFADPGVFKQRYGERFNAEMDGIDVLRTVEANPDCRGVQVNNALSETSMIISRGPALATLRGETGTHKPWWKLWQ